MKKRSMKLAVILLALLATITACGNSKSDNSYLTSEAAYDTAYNTASYDAGSGYDYIASTTQSAPADIAYEYENQAVMEEDIYDEGGNASAEILDENPNTSNTSNRKLIKNVDLSVETENYDALLGNLSKKVTELGGYIEYQYEYNGRIYSEYNENRNANWEIRIPVQRLDEFIVLVGDESNITNKTERITDVTLQYVDLESHKTALLTEQKRLLELLEQAENVEDLITVEQRLSEVRYELEYMESQLRLLDNKIDYSTVNLSIQEVKREIRVEENSVWDRIRNGFVGTIYDIGDGIEDGFISFVINIPYIVIWLVVVIVLVFIFRKVIRLMKKRKMKKFGKGSEDISGKTNHSDIIYQEDTRRDERKIEEKKQEENSGEK